ncbi:MAG: transcriptional regulator with GAF, ATPase, and Fis domain [Candidatus Omnitrophota bacterium]|jgi:transcriptional regulator with GAF, ATPase, and Fis domain
MRDKDFGFGQLQQSYVESINANLQLLVDAIGDDQEIVVSRWCKLYQGTFKPAAGLTMLRMQPLFSNICSLLVESIQSNDWEVYFAEIRSIGRLFHELNVPFREVLLCLHLFQRACLSHIETQPKFANSPFDSLIQALDEISYIGTTVLALSYFRCTRLQWDRDLNQSRVEFNRIDSQLKQTQERDSAINHGRLHEMDSVISDIVLKINRNKFQTKILISLQSTLSQSSKKDNIIKTGAAHIRKCIPAEFELCFGIKNQGGSKLAIYQTEDPDSLNPKRATLDCEIAAARWSAPIKQSLDNGCVKHFLIGTQDEDCRFIMPSTRKPEAKWVCLIPLNYQGHNMGVIWISSNESERPNKELQKLLKRISTIMSSSLMASSYLNQAKQQTAMQDFPILESTDNHHQQLDTYLTWLLGALGIERVSLMRYDSQMNVLSICAAKGARVYPFSGLKLKVGEGVAGASLNELKPICLTQANIASHGEVQIKSLACIPLAIDGEAKGVLNLSTITYHKEFDTKDVSIAMRAADAIAPILNSIGSK